jgi:HK97 family phage portal protein
LPTWRSRSASPGAVTPEAYSPLTTPPTFPPSIQKASSGYTGRLLSLAQFFAAQSTSFGEEETLQDPFKQLAIVYACVMARARPLAMCPLKLYRSKEVDGEKVYEEVDNHPLSEVLSTPNPHLSRYQLLEAWEQSICITGKFFLFLDRAGYTDPPKEMWPLPSDRMSPVRDKKGLPTAWEYDPGGKKKVITYPLHQILYEKLWDPDDPIGGLSPLVAAGIVTKAEWAALQFNYFFLMRGCEPGGRYQMEGMPSQDQLLSLDREHRDKYEGPHNVGKTMVDWGGAEWKPYPIPQKDAQFQEMRHMNLRDVMMALGVMKINLGLEEMNYAQALEMKKMFWHNTLIPRVKSIEDSLYHSMTKHVDGGQLEILFDLDSVEALREGIETKSTTAVELVKGGVPWAEVNRLLDLGLEEFEGWDIPYSLKPSAPALPSPEEEPEGEEIPEKAAPAGEEIVFEEIDPADAEYNAKWDREILTPQEKKFQAKMSRFFMEHRNEVLDRFGKVTNWDGKDLPPRSWRLELSDAGIELPPMTDYKAEETVTLNVESLLPNEDESVAKLDKYTRPLYEDSLLQGAGARSVGLGTETQITQITDELSAWIDKMCIDKNMTVVNDTLRDALRETLQEGIKQRETLQELAGRIKHIHKNAKNRSMTIARTEVGRAANHGAYIESEESGIVEGHVWITGGFNIRDSHASIHGQFRKIGEVFSNGLMYPNDPNGSAGETVNCKCNLRERLSK